MSETSGEKSPGKRSAESQEETDDVCIKTARQEPAAAPQSSGDAAKIDFVNFTEHAVVIYDSDGKTVLRTIEPFGYVVRLKSSEQVPVVIAGADVPLATPQNFVGVDWPTEVMMREGSHVIVSSFVGQYYLAHPEKAFHNIYATDTGPASVVRGDKGQILGVKRLNPYVGPDIPKF